MKTKFIQQSQEYKDWLRELKARVRQVQLKAAVSVNQELLSFYTMVTVLNSITVSSVLPQTSLVTSEQICF